MKINVRDFDGNIFNICISQAEVKFKRILTLEQVSWDNYISKQPGAELGLFWQNRSEYLSVESD